MGETEYTYAVARIRANELNLLTAGDVEQLVAADSVAGALRILGDKGWNTEEKGDICEAELDKARRLICESVSDSGVFDALIIGNDFANLKAAIKAFFSNIDASKYMTVPCVIPAERVIEAVKTKSFSLLPDYMRECAERAYNAVSETESGQSSEIIIDKCCLDTRMMLAEKSGSEILKKIAGLDCVTANIKIALRSVKTGKSREFALNALSTGCKALDNEKLVDCTFKGESLAPVIAGAGYPEIAEAADRDFVTLEMAADNLTVQFSKTAKYDIFGADAVVAYYYAKLIEEKNVRIILSSKESGVPKESVTERVREMYV